MRIFISHLHRDDDLALELKTSLREQSASPSAVSIVLASGVNAAPVNLDDIRERVLIPRLRWAQVLIVLLTGDTCDSYWVRWEIAYAQKRNKKIVGVFAPGSDATASECVQEAGGVVVAWNMEEIWNLLSP